MTLGSFAIGSAPLGGSLPICPSVPRCNLIVMEILQELRRLGIEIGDIDIYHTDT